MLRPRRVRSPTRAIAALATLAYLPMVLTKPGQVSADTKSYLTLNPGRLLAEATSMWDSSVGAGTVPHQTIGYLFPIGPYYWVMDAIGVPDWLTQRLVWATIVFAAAVGVLRLLSWLGWSTRSAFVAACFYGFSPYLLSYLARLSAILFPWAALPWLVLLAARAIRDRSWSTPAKFAAVVAVVGSVNATSLVLVGLGPIVWIVADAASGRVQARAVLVGASRIGVLSAAVSMWWIVGLAVQGSYGLAILDYTESYQTVASASTPNEILRGLGYWFFYGGDRIGTWVGPSSPYINNAAVMFLGYGIAGLAVLGLLVRFVGRASMTALFVVGLIVSVGAAPLASSTIYGRFFEAFATETTVGGALRSTPRAAPLVLLGLACGFGAGAEAVAAWLAQRRPTVRVTWVHTVAVGLVAVQLFPWFTGTVTTPSLLRPQQLPSSVEQLAAVLNADDARGRVYTLPGADFADYRWGGTVDPVLAGLTDRSILYRELVPQGGAGTADLLNALERRFVEGWFEPTSLGPITSLFNVDTVVVRNDLQYERYRLARPGIVWTDTIAALGQPSAVGVEMIDRPAIPMTDEITLAHRDAPTSFPTYGVFDRAPHAEIAVIDAESPLVVMGSGDGLVDLAASGLISAGQPVLYGATVSDAVDDGTDRDVLVGSDPWWVITDSNRKQGRRWSTIGFNLGTIEGVGPAVTDDDPNDHRLELFDDSIDEQTIAVELGDVADVRATSYGSDILYTAEDAPVYALDGDPATAWRTAIAEPTVGERLVIELKQPTALSELVLQQPQIGANNRYITQVRLSVDGEEVDVALDESSRTTGQRIDVVALGIGNVGQTGAVASEVSVEVLADNVGAVSSYAGFPGVGFAEVTLIRPDGSEVTSDRSVQVPTSNALGISHDQRLSYVFTRDRFDPATPNRRSPEEAIDRVFDVPDVRLVELTAQVRVASTAPESVLAALLDRDAVVDTEAGAARPSAQASVRLEGSVPSRGAAAVDGRLDTAWQTPFDAAVGATLSMQLGSTQTANSVTVSWLDDGVHDVPTLLEFIAGDSRFTVQLPPTAPVDGTSTATIEVPEFAVDQVTLTIIETQGATTPEYFSGVGRKMPVGLAEVYFGDQPHPVGEPASLSGECRDDLVVLDGQPLGIRITSDGQGGAIASACEPIELSHGDHRITAAPGRSTGIDIDRILLDSPGSGTSVSGTSGPGSQPAAAVTVDALSDTAIDATIGAADSARWLILPQSLNQGWSAQANGVDLGPPVLINGYANGWLIEPTSGTQHVELRWTPQRNVRIGIWLSVVAGLVIIALIAIGARRGQHHSRTLAVFDADVDIATTGHSSSQTAVVAAFWVVGWAVAGGPGAALASAAVLLTSFRWRRRDARQTGAVLFCIGWGLVSGLIIAFEYRYNFADGPDWQERFLWASPLTWAAVAAVVTAIGVDTVRGRRARSRVSRGA